MYDIPSYITIVVVVALFGGLWWWGKAIEKEFGEGSDRSKPIKKPLLDPPGYRMIPRDRDQIVQEWEESGEPINKPAIREVIPQTRDDAPIKPVVQLLAKYGEHALSDPMSIEDLRKFISTMISSGYELKKVWPNKGSFHIAYLIFSDR